MSILPLPVYPCYSYTSGPKSTQEYRTNKPTFHPAPSAARPSGVPTAPAATAASLAPTGASDFWRGGSKRDIREYLHPCIRRSVADFKQARLLRADIVPGDTKRYVRLVPESDDILVVYAGAPTVSGYRCAVILRELPKVASAAVTKAIQRP